MFKFEKDKILKNIQISKCLDIINMFRICKSILILKNVQISKNHIFKNVCNWKNSKFEKVPILKNV
jgi:hypothetical protein